MKHKWGDLQLSFAPPAQQKAFQERAFRDLLRYLDQASPFYKKLFSDNSIDINTAELQQIPCTSKEDLQLHNQDFLCVPSSAIVEYTATSGTLGSPVTIALTENDLKRLAYNEYCSFRLMGLSEQDTIQLMLTLDKQFMAGMAYYQGARAIGAACVRTGPGLPAMQLRTIKDLKVSTLIAVPSFLIKLIETAKQEGFDINELPVRKVLAIGESLYDAAWGKSVLHQRILQHWRIDMYSSYASTEMQTAFTSCNSSNGLHLNPELLIVEFLDEEGRAVGEGDIGEITITTLGVEGMPLLRYRTGDLCRFTTAPCSCGRHALRIGGILGRKKQLIKFKGTSIYPNAIFELLNKETWIANYLVGIHQNSDLQDEVRIQLVCYNDDLRERLSDLKDKFKAELRVVPELELSNPEALLDLQFPNGSRKQLKIIDYRP